MAAYQWLGQKVLAVVGGAFTLIGIVGSSAEDGFGSIRLPEEVLRATRGSTKTWRWIVDRTCAHQTWSDFNGSEDPDEQAKAKGAIYTACTASDIQAGKKCWDCTATGVTHSVFVGGTIQEGSDYTATSCGELLEGTCRWVNPDNTLGEDPKKEPTSQAVPKCYEPEPVENVSCTAAQVKGPQCIE